MSEWILVVDDDPQMRGLIREYLEQDGFNVCEARDAREAYNKLSTNPDSFALAIMDRRLPGGDGIELLLALRAHGCCREMPVIFLSALADPGDIGEGLSAGATNYLPKPCAREKFLASVHAAMRGGATEKIPPNMC